VFIEVSKIDILINENYFFIALNISLFPGAPGAFSIKKPKDFIDRFKFPVIA
jgi:hypothetical protein